MNARTRNPQEISVTVGTDQLHAVLRMPAAPIGIVLFAHGSGSGRHSPRNTYVAERLGQARLASLLLDLLTEQEEAVDVRTAELRFDIPLLTERLVAVTEWTHAQPPLKDLPIGYFGASTGAAAALAAAARLDSVMAVVSRGGRPDLAGTALPRVRAATLLIVGGNDEDVLLLNREALKQLRCDALLEVVPGATHLFAEPGALEHVATLAVNWFRHHLHAAAVEQAPLTSPASPQRSTDAWHGSQAAAHPPGQAPARRAPR
jgi:dienelactone hydrolase